MNSKTEDFLKICKYLLGFALLLGGFGLLGFLLFQLFERFSLRLRQVVLLDQTQFLERESAFLHTDIFGGRVSVRGGRHPHETRAKPFAKRKFLCEIDWLQYTVDIMIARMILPEKNHC